MPGPSYRVGWIGVVAGIVLALSTGRLGLSRSQPNELRFVHTFTTDSERAIVDRAIAEFERAHPPIRIRQIIFNSETYQSVGWRLQFQGSKQSDIFFTWRGVKTELATARRWALDLTPYLSPGFIDQFIPAAVLSPRKTEIDLLPHSVDLSNLIWYNRDLFASQNLSPPPTLSAWLNLSKRLRLAHWLALGQGNRDLWPMGNLAAELLGQSLGAPQFGRLFAAPTTVTPADLAGLEPLRQLRDEGCFDLPGLLEPGAIGALSDIDAKVLFLSGKSGQHIVGSWFVADIHDAMEKGELKFKPGVFAVPAEQGQIDAMTSVITGFQVNARTRNPRAAVEFIELLLSRRYQSEFGQIGNLSARRDAAEFTSDPLVKEMLAIRNRVTVTVPPPDTGFRPEQAAVFYDLCGRLLTGKLNIAGATEFWNAEKRRLSAMNQE